jgi:rhodanese-related sulfurtransferase
MSNTAPERIPINELKKKLESSKKPTVIDVREPKEVAESGSIPGAIHVPMNKVEQRMGEFVKNSEIVFY